MTNGSIFSAFGATREEALSELHITAEAYFEALVAAGKPLPLPEKVTPYSGQLRLRMPKRLHAALSNEAEGENISLNTYIVSLYLKDTSFPPSITDHRQHIKLKRTTRSIEVKN